MSAKETFPNLNKNPITAAIFEIRHLFTVPSFDIDTLSSFHQLIKDRYPTLNKGFNRNIHIQDLPNGKAKATVSGNQVIELRFISDDKKRSLLINSNVFNLNITGHYSTWDEYYTDFFFLYSKFYDFVVRKYSLILIGASARFINKLLLDEVHNPADYFNTTIYAEKDAVPNDVTSYVMKYIAEVADQNVQIQVTQGFEPVVDNKTPYLFDIDVIYNKLFEFDELKNIYDELHYLKNKTFFNNLTEKTLNLLQ